jgi:2OG-Fe(II) oxygenase superfamily
MAEVPVARELLPPGKAVLLEGLFSAEECAELLLRAEGQGFQPATVKIQATTLRGESHALSKSNSFILDQEGGAGASKESGDAGRRDSSQSPPPPTGAKREKEGLKIDAQAVVGDIRNNDSVVLHDAEDLVKDIWERVQRHLPENVLHGDLDEGLGTSNPMTPDTPSDPATAVGLGADMVRVYRYKEGHRFVRHYDGYEFGSVVYTNKKGAKGPMAVPLLSLLLYLNDKEGNFAGGETNFFTTQGQKLLSVEPKCGSVLVYTQRLLHEGAQVTSLGPDSPSPCKYVFRADILFVRDSEVEAYEHREVPAGDGEEKPGLLDNCRLM